MEGIPAKYLGRLVPKKGFRAFVYDMDGNQKISESWGDFLNHTGSGVWFDTREAAAEAKQAIELSKIEIEAQKPEKASKKGESLGAK